MSTLKVRLEEGLNTRTMQPCWFAQAQVTPGQRWVNCIDGDQVLAFTDKEVATAFIQDWREKIAIEASNE